MTSNLVRAVVFTVVTLALTGLIAAKIVGFELGTDRYTLAAVFDDVLGLSEGDPVKLAGVPVGEVSSVDVAKGRADVSFSVDRTVRLPADSAVSVRWLNLIGQRYLSLEPGSSADLLGDGDQVERIGNVVDLGQLVNQLAPLARQVSPDHLNRILDTLLVAFDGNDAVFDELLADLDSVLGSVAQRAGTIDQLVVDLDVISSAIADRDRQIQAMVSNLVAVSESFAGNDALLEQALDEISRFSVGLDELLARGADDFGGVLESLAVLTNTATDNITELEAALNNLPPLFAALLPTINYGEYLRVNVLCLTPNPGPCPLPMSLGTELSGGGG